MPRAGRGFPSEPLARSQSERSVVSSSGSITAGAPATRASSVSISGNGQLAPSVAKGGISASVGISGGGTVAVVAQRSMLVLPATMVFGGGGRIGRSMPVRPAVILGVALPRANTQTAQSSAAISGNGIVQTSTIKNGSSSVSLSTNGLITASGFQSLALIPIMVIGGGGRIGRSMPVQPLINRNYVTPVATGNRNGAAQISGNGLITVVGNKQIVSSSEVLGFPPIFQNFTVPAGIVISGNGFINVTGSAASNARTGSARISGGGTFALAAITGRLSVVTVSGKGLLNTAAKKATSNSASISGNGLTNVIGQRSPRNSASISGNGLITATDRKNALRGVSISGNGIISAQDIHNATNALLLSGGGRQFLTDFKAANSSAPISGGGDARLQVLGSVSILLSGGGNAKITARKDISVPISSSCGANIAIATRKGINLPLSLSGNGNLTVISHIATDFASAVKITGNGTIVTIGQKNLTRPIALTGNGGITLRFLGSVNSGTIRISGNGLIEVKAHVIPNVPEFGRTKVYGGIRRTRVRAW